MKQLIGIQQKQSRYCNHQKRRKHLSGFVLSLKLDPRIESQSRRALSSNTHIQCHQATPKSHFISSTAFSKKLLPKRILAQTPFTSVTHSMRNNLYGIKQHSTFSTKNYSTQNRQSAAALESLRSRPNLKILGIETSCDDTCAAIIDSSKRIWSNYRITESTGHVQNGGIVPTIAMRNHQKYLGQVVEEAMKRAHLTFVELDAIAVTVGPGLKSCLNVGIKMAKDLCLKHHLPLIPVNHLEGHALVPRLESDLHFPFFTVLTSGGHSQFLLCHNVGEYTFLGGTRDDSLGEAYDKVARLLGLSFEQGGPGLEKLAKTGDPKAYPFPTVLTKNKLSHRDSLDLSFSGLKSATCRLVEKLQAENLQNSGVDSLTEQQRSDIAAGFQTAALHHLISRLKAGLERTQMDTELSNKGHDLSSLVLCGGVARNQQLRAQLQQTVEEFNSSNQKNLQLICPSLSLCTDNAAMIAWAAHEIVSSGSLFSGGIFVSEEEIGNMVPISRWPLDSTYQDLVASGLF